MSRATMPPLELQYPVCMLCGETVDHDGDGFHCPRCDARWPDDAIGQALGQWERPDARQCEAIDGRFLPGGSYSRSALDPTLYRCMLGGGHVSDHMHANKFTRRQWDSKHRATSEQLAAVAG